MRCEPPQKTPLQIAQDDLAHWARRQRQLIAELAEVDRQFAEDGARVDSLCRESISASALPPNSATSTSLSKNPNQ